MEGRKVKLLSVLVAVVRSFERKRSTRAMRAPRAAARAGAGSQMPAYAMSSTLPPMR